MSYSRQEIQLRRLLAKSELLLKEDRSDERFPKYVASLETMLKDLLKVPVKPSEESINDYKKRIYHIKSSLDLATEEDKVFLLNQMYDENQIRNSLFGLRQRKVAEETASPEGLDDLEKVIQHHQDVQDKIAQDMLSLTQSLKEQSELANRIIKQDTQVVSQSAQLTDKNLTNLKSESEKLMEHSKRACKCWMWVMLVIVFVVFINMVLFMKVMKKK